MTAEVIVLRPFGHLVGQGIVAVLALTLPIFAVIYWLTVPTGDWPIVVGVQILVMVAAIVVVVAFYGTTIRLEPGGVRERGFFGRVSLVRADQVRSIRMVDVYQNGTLETQPQMFVIGLEGRLLLRMRGQFWSLESMERVAERLDSTIVVEPEAMTVAQLRRGWPELLYWFERFPWRGR